MTAHQSSSRRSRRDSWAAGRNLLLAALLALSTGGTAQGEPAPISTPTPAPVSTAHADSTWIQHLRAARIALVADDFAGARYQLLAVDSLVGGYASAKSILATLAALQGDRAGVLRWLLALGETGLSRSVAADTTFARWHDDMDFKTVAAMLDANATPVSNATVAYSLGDPALLAEDVAWDARGKRFLISSIHERKIIAIDAAGRVTNFTKPAADGIWGIYGLALDAERGVLWATTAAGPECEGYVPADSGRTALLAYKLSTARLLDRIELPRTADRQTLGDVMVGPDGTVVASEGYGGAVYRLLPGTTTLETLVAPGTFRSSQTPALAADGKRLYVADWSRGIAVVDLESHAVSWLPKPYSLASGGIDGLYLYGARLIAIQNGTNPHRVLELTLDPAGARIVAWRVLEQASAHLGEPNHGVLVGNDLYFIGDSGWERVGDDGQLQTTPDSRPPVLLKLNVGGTK